jgi:hypothetical protein
MSGRYISWAVSDIVLYPSIISSSFTDQQTAFDTGLAYVTDDNIVVMKGDDTTWLAEGQLRPRCG